MAENPLDEIIKIIGEKKQEMEAVLPQISSEITAIISEKERDIKNIESILDILLGYIQVGVGEAEFRRLNSYYSSFNADNAKFYADAYDEMLRE